MHSILFLKGDTESGDGEGGEGDEGAEGSGDGDGENDQDDRAQGSQVSSAPSLQRSSG